ncbi:hypothetical protein AV530_005654 [Patagioenas fasciata monilis]|uniref:Uncharacterized protein n=1 Tax=Patagioenas fasciata monilis TaxID=372326 RepID=A0A1V4JM59_PATFA|nr:hypothetical protein AV530_005654 [Patagioenas fasciata monilis]
MLEWLLQYSYTSMARETVQTAAPTGGAFLGSGRRSAQRSRRPSAQRNSAGGGGGGRGVGEDKLKPRRVASGRAGMFAAFPTGL